MNRILRCATVACGVAFLLVATACAGDDGTDATITPDGTPVEVLNAYIPEPPTDTAAAYVVFRNHQGEADRLVSATADVTETVELHQTRMDGGAMTMAQLDGIDLPAGGELLMEPGGIHVMLVDLTRELQEGDTVAMTFTFERAGTMEVSVPVVPSSGEPEMEMDHGSGGNAHH